MKKGQQEDMFIFFFIIFTFIKCEKHLIKSTKNKNNGGAFIIETHNMLPVETDNDVMESKEYVDNTKVKHLIETVNKEGYVVETYPKMNVNKHKKTKWSQPEIDMENNSLEAETPPDWTNIGQ